MNLDRTGVGHHKRKKKRIQRLPQEQQKRTPKSQNWAQPNQWRQSLHGEGKIAVLHQRVAGGVNHGMSAEASACGGFWRRRWSTAEEEKSSPEGLYTGKKKHLVLAREKIYPSCHTAVGVVTVGQECKKHVGQGCKKHVGK